jgi:hypothetical protein
VLRECGGVGLEGVRETGLGNLAADASLALLQHIGDSKRIVNKD